VNDRVEDLGLSLKCVRLYRHVFMWQWKEQRQQVQKETTTCGIRQTKDLVQVTYR
jgi:hypothetical protein